ncbi:variant erythrocyte surface antigen-1 family protein [Babesia caballi]|uniref:Variant erythrocyte surface antigen-1 family protein n=1 Tax=Babesia caballi TaxID=5871 RepID=A0AAV4LMR3_BABCB|nr:variant erythrocyte surface antigen-1 family protein [Babesia caballi]
MSHYLPQLTSNSGHPSNVKEAIDRILRVTGKDGQNGGGTDGANDLTEQIKKLLKSVIDSDPKLTVDIGNIEKVIQALNTNSGTGLIAKLAEGLQQFIGYDSRGKITGGGILPANVAKYQVCNAVLNFVIRFLEGLSKVNEASYKQNVSNVIVTLRKCVGTGTVPTGFGELVQKIGEMVKQGFDSKVKQNNQTGKLNNVFHALKGIIDHIFSSEHETHTVKNETQNVRNYLDAVNDNVTPDGSSKFKNLNESIAKLFSDNKLTSNMSDTTHLATGTLTNFKNVNPDSINGDIHTLSTEGKFKDHANAAVFTAVRDAAKSFIAEIQTKAYTSYYKGANWKESISYYAGGESQVLKTKCAKIFLGCLPLYYQALTYIYWGCHTNGGGWRNLTLAGGALRSYFDSQGLLPTFVESSRTGAHIAESALQKFSEFSQGMTNASSPPLSSATFPYVKFTEALRGLLNTEQQTSLPSQCPLSALFHGASCYFRYQQMTNAKEASKSPKTIREMLYFLAALQFSPQYDEFDGYVTSHFKAVTGSKSSDDSELKLQVAVSGLSTPNNTLSAADLKSYLASTFLLPPSLLGWLQGPSASISDEPWLFELYSNSIFQFKYSSGAGIFGALSNYAYALQFQLSFLYIQCRDTYTVGCGWRDCRFGRDVNAAGKDVQSHICGAYQCDGKPDCQHDGSGNNIDCKHNSKDGPTCGKGSNNSPLQAFLTDCLPGFSLIQPSDPSSHPATCSGVLCHVPMGFAGKLRTDACAGLNVAYALGSFCGGFNTPLRQLSEKLSCLTKRTPRSLGDMFGFTWHLKGQVSKSFETVTSAGWFSDLVKHTPFSSTVKEHINVLKTFVGTGHTDSNSHNTADLSSLYSLKCDQQTYNCGPYLYPLTHSDGATFGKPAPYASTYLSWMVYLTDELETGFQEFLDTFNGHVCKGCKHKSSHSTGSAATACSCPSVVDCADVLPLLYRHGFRFLSAFRLKGMKKESNSYTQTAASKRKCSAFQSQLQAVISGNPLSSLLTSIDEFLYMFRYYFLSNLSGFWTIYMCLILYTFFFLLDTLHLRSHLRLTSSHTVPPLALLTTGKALPITKLTYIGQ